jgi:hypothetical protein
MIRQPFIEGVPTYNCIGVGTKSGFCQHQPFQSVINFHPKALEGVFIPGPPDFR